MPLHERETVNERLADCVFVGRDMTRPVPKYRFPRNETLPREAFQVVSDELMLDGNSRQNLATFCQTWTEPEVHAADGRVHRQEHDRQGRVSADRRDRAPLRAHAGRPVELARRRPTPWAARPPVRARPRMLGGHGHEVALARKRRAAGTARPTARTWSAARCRSAGTSSPATGTSSCARSRWPTTVCCMTPEEVVRRVRREHHRRGAHAGRHVHRRSTSRSRTVAEALDELQADTRARHPDPRRRRQRRLSGALHARPTLVWDFRLPRVKSINTSGHKFGLAPLGVRLGGLARHGRAARGPDLPRQLPGRRHADVRAQLLPPGRADHRAVLQLPAAGPRGLPARSTRPATRPAQYLAARDRQARPVRDDLRRRPGDGHPGRLLEDQATATIPATPCTTSPTGCARAAGRCPPTPCRPTGSDIVVQRILVRHGVSRDMASLLLDDFRSALAHFSRHPITVPISKEESSTFNHL